MVKPAAPVHPVPSCCCPGRRAFLASAGRLALGVAAASSLGPLASAQPAPATGAGLIDVHHHHIPPFYLAENKERIVASFGGTLGPAWTTWAPERALEALDRNGVATAVLSLSTPGVWFGDPAEARRIARRVNDYAAGLGRDHPGRFGLFAVIPLPDPEGSLAEIAYAFDVLKADGIGLLTSYGDHWLGDPVFRPVFEELNRRKAVVFVHPTVPGCCRTLLADVPPVIEEIPQDTARAIANLLYTGTLARYPEVRFIFCHAGGTLPMVYGRMLQVPPKNLAERAPHGIDYELRKLYFDVAATAIRPAMAALTSLVPISQILLGTDHPYVPAEKTVGGLQQLGFSVAELRAIGRDNALRLLPGLPRAPGPG